MIKKYDDLPTWQFEFDEVSANVYEIVGTSEQGHKVSAKGLDVDQLIEQCKESAHKIEDSLRSKRC
jgi:hypothetical protein